MRIKLIIFLLAMLPTVAFSQTASEQLQATLAQIKTLQAHFSQTLRSEEGQTLQRSSGDMALHRPGKFRWHIRKPMEQLIVADGSKLWIYDPDLAQVTVKSLKGEVTQTPALFLSGYDQSAIEDYHVQMKSVIKQKKYTLTPKNNEASFTTIELSFRGLKLTRMRLIDQLGQRSEVKFSRVQVNATLPANLFIFKPPSGVDVIR